VLIPNKFKQQELAGIRNVLRQGVDENGYSGE